MQTMKRASNRRHLKSYCDVLCDKSIVARLFCLSGTIAISSPTQTLDFLFLYSDIKQKRTFINAIQYCIHDTKKHNDTMRSLI